MINRESFQWKEYLVWAFFVLNSVEAILWLDKHVVHCHDSLLWIDCTNETYYVKSSFQVLNRGKERVPINEIWKVIWKLKGHEQVKRFLWWLVAQVFPTNQVLNAKLNMDFGLCPICGLCEESSVHIFKECQFIRALTFASKWSIRVDGFGGSNVEELVSWCLHTNGRLVGNSGGKDSLFIYIYIYFFVFCVIFEE